MPNKDTFVEHLTRQGISRRSFLKFCALTASSLALPTGSAKVIAQMLEVTPRPTVIWLSSHPTYIGWMRTVCRTDAI